MKITYADPKKEDWFLVSWTLSNKCNYRCSYCPDFLHNGSSGQPDWETVSNFIKNFKIPGKKICYRITGGEPTFWKHFVDMAKLVKDEGHAFSFITNGSRTVEYYKTISQYTDGMIISYHPEYADIQHFIDVANKVYCETAINLMMVPDQFDEQVAIAKRMYNDTTRLAIWPKVIVDKTSLDYVTNEVSNYTEEQQKIISEWPYFRKLNDEHLHRGDILYNEQPITANDLIVKELNNHKGWKCWAGLHMIKIDMYGKIFRSECEQGGPIGDLKDYNLPTETITCGKTVCACLSDIYLMKQA
jgi:organic radical activating enzyme